MNLIGQGATVPKDLLAEYFLLLKFHGAANGLFRVPPKLLDQLEEGIRRPGKEVVHPLNYAVALDGNPLQRLLDASQARLLRSTRLRGAIAARPAFVGLFTRHAFDARHVPKASGDLILVNVGALMVTLDLLWSAVHRVPVHGYAPMTTDFGEGPPPLHWFDVFTDYLTEKHLTVAFAPRRGAWSVLAHDETGLIKANGKAPRLFVDAARPCVDFFVAHEYGHLLAGHAAFQGEGERNVVEECEADAIALDLLDEIWPPDTALPTSGRRGKGVRPHFPQMALFNLTLAWRLRHFEAQSAAEVATLDDLYIARRRQAVERLGLLTRPPEGSVLLALDNRLNEAARAYNDARGTA